jgi:PRTRC genetic system protein E
MFQQLVPLLRQRSVLLTVTSLEEDQIRVNVMPKKLADGENAALTTPMSFTGTAAELDAQLPDAIVSFVASHLELKNTLGRAKDEMAAAAKAAQDEARNKAKNKKKPDAGTKAELLAKEEPKIEPIPPRPPSLFDTTIGVPAAEPRATTTAASSVALAPASSATTEEDEITAEIAEREADESEDEAA